MQQAEEEIIRVINLLCPPLYESLFKRKRVLFSVRFPENFKSCGDIDFKKFDIADELIISGHLPQVTKAMLSGLRKVKKIVIVSEVDKIEAMAFSDSITGLAD